MPELADSIAIDPSRAGAQPGTAAVEDLSSEHVDAIKIPASLVPRAPLNYEAEIRQILGFDLALPSGLRIPPLTAARLMALELVSSPFFLHPDSCEAVDVARALVLLTASRASVPMLTAESAELTQQAALMLSEHGAEIAAAYPRIVEWVLQVPFYGFAMRPGGRGREREWWFDGEFAGAVVAPAARIMGTPVDVVLWETPLCLVGHAVAQHDASLGVKGVERPPDVAALDRMTEEARQRELRGELHPWQRVDPRNYPMTATQQRHASLETIAEYHRILDRFNPQPGTNLTLDPGADPRAGAQPGTAAVEDLSCRPGAGENLTMNCESNSESPGARAKPGATTVEDLSSVEGLSS